MERLVIKAFSLRHILTCPVLSEAQIYEVCNVRLRTRYGFFDMIDNPLCALEQCLG